MIICRIVSYIKRMCAVLYRCANRVYFNEIYVLINLFTSCTCQDKKGAESLIENIKSVSGMVSSGTFSS